jgi:hypothetical protein
MEEYRIFSKEKHNIRQFDLITFNLVSELIIDINYLCLGVLLM